MVQAALHQFVQWASGGPPPPAGTPLELDEQTTSGLAIARDPNGNARGGVRNPLVDVPTATLTGEPPNGTTLANLQQSGVCILCGQTIPFDTAKLVDLYGTADNYVTQFRASADEAVTAGFLLRPDADALIAEAEQNRPLFG